MRDVMTVLELTAAASFVVVGALIWRFNAIRRSHNGKFQDSTRSLDGEKKQGSPDEDR